MEGHFLHKYPSLIQTNDEWFWLSATHLILSFISRLNHCHANFKEVIKKVPIPHEATLLQLPGPQSWRLQKTTEVKILSIIYLITCFSDYPLFLSFMEKYAHFVQMRAKLTRESKHSHSQYFHLHVNKPSCYSSFRILTKEGNFAPDQYFGRAEDVTHPHEVCIPSAQPPCYIDMYSLRFLFKKLF